MSKTNQNLNVPRVHDRATDDVANIASVQFLAPVSRDVLFCLEWIAEVGFYLVIIK